MKKQPKKEVKLPTKSKIPKELKGTAVASGSWAVFAGIIRAGKIFTMLQDIPTTKAVPISGYFTDKAGKVYYCRYGFINDKEIYK
jgi:hypothetical protein